MNKIQDKCYCKRSVSGHMFLTGLWQASIW